MRHLQSLLCQQDGKASAAGPAVKDRPDAVQVRQQFLFDMRLLHDIVNKGLLPFRFQLAFVRLIPHPFGDLCTVVHNRILPVAYRSLPDCGGRLFISRPAETTVRDIMDQTVCRIPDIFLFR